MIASANDTCGIEVGELLKFAAGDAQGSARRRILEHLLKGCDRCRSALAAIRGVDTEVATTEEDELPSISRILSSLGERAARIERERADAAALMPEFLQHPVARQWTLVRNSRKFDTWSFAAGLLDASFTAVIDDAPRARNLAEMALAISDRLDAARYGERAARDLAGRCWSHLGNAQRTLGDLAAAEASLAKARECWQQGTGDPLDEAELLYFEASLLRGRRRFDEALRRVRRSARLYRELGDTHLEARSKMNEAQILLLKGDPRAAKDLTASVLPSFDSSRDPQISFLAHHNLVWYTMECGESEEALRSLAAFRSEYSASGHRLTGARLHWLEARIFDQLGRDEEVEASYQRSIDSFAELELPYELANTSLDLAAFFARKGRITEVRQIAERTMVLFRAIGVAEPMIAAWMIFQRAAEAEAVTAGLIERLVRYHAEARYRPELEFQG